MTIYLIESHPCRTCGQTKPGSAFKRRKSKPFLTLCDTCRDCLRARRSTTTKEN